MKTGTLFIALCAAALTALPAAAQSQAAQPAPGVAWSLDDCMDYALENNISVQQYKLKIEQSDLQLSTAKYSRLPDLNASAGVDYTHSQNYKNPTPSDPSAGYYAKSDQTGGSLNVSAGVPIFQGMRINRQIKGGKLDLEATIQDLERVRENVQINIMGLYLQALYAKELLGVARNQLDLSTQQAERSRELVRAGKQPESAWYESDALRANDRMNLTQAEIDLQQALLNLSQALNRPSAAGFDIVAPTLDSSALAQVFRHSSADEVYDYAVDNRPHIKSERLRLKSSENAVRIAKSYFYPTISAYGSYGTGFDFSSRADKFSDQFRHNGRIGAGISMNIPIFNRMATRNNVRAAKISVRNQELVLADAELSLRKEIEQAWYNANAAYAKYSASQSALASAKVAFAYEQEKADAGRSTIFDFNDAKTRMERAESDLAQSKYEFVFRSKILDFYRGRPLTL